MLTYDHVVIGTGIAGLSFALKAAEHGRVAIVTKRAPAESNTRYAQGGIACVTAADDSFDLHIADTLEAGAGLCDESVVRAIVTDAPARIAELIAIGVQFDAKETQPGEPPHELDLGREGGHSRRRILHARDITGREIEEALLRAVAAHPSIELLANHIAIDLITLKKLGHVSADRCLGAYVLDEATGHVLTLRTDRLILATGGCGKVYLYTTNPAIATGDGLAMAWRAGAKIANMEFIQFHPTCLYHPDAGSFLISEAVRGEGAKLIDAQGRQFMEKYDDRLELAPRDIVARAIDAEMKRTAAKCVFLDLRHKDPDYLRTRFPNIYATCLRHGIDITRDPIPVVPAAHYQCGGILTDQNGATSLPGLFAIGEVACTGLHGANRLASNSLLEAVVIAHRCATLLGGGENPASSASAAIELRKNLATEGTEATEGGVETDTPRKSASDASTASSKPTSPTSPSVAFPCPSVAKISASPSEPSTLNPQPSTFSPSPPALTFDDIPIPPWSTGDLQNVDELIVIYHNWDEIRRLMWDYVGIVRTTKRLQRAARRLLHLQQEIQESYWNFKITTDLLELRNLATVAGLIVDSALLRRESRGLHHTLDFPHPDDRLRRPTLLQRTA